MSYPRTLDEYDQAELVGEIARRQLLQSQGLCDYCGRRGDAAPCRFCGRHEAALLEIKRQRQQYIDSINFTPREW